MHLDWFQMNPQERLDALRERIALGDSITLIALRYQASRGAISGALARAGLTTVRPQSANLVKGSVSSKPKTTFNTFERNPAKKRAREARDAAKLEAENAKDEQQRVSRLPPWLPALEMPPRPLESLHPTKECTWPLWPNGTLAPDNKTRLPEDAPRVYCGGPCVDLERSYCKVHLRMAYKVMPVLNSPYGDTDGQESRTAGTDLAEPAERAKGREAA